MNRSELNVFFLLENGGELALVLQQVELSFVEDEAECRRSNIGFQYNATINVCAASRLGRRGPCGG